MRIKLIKLKTAEKVAIAVIIVVMLLTSIAPALGKFNIFRLNLVNEQYLTPEKQEYMNDFLNKEVETKVPIAAGEVKNFSFEKNTLTFKNLGTQNSPDGICLGIAIFEKKMFEDTIVNKRIIDKEQTYSDVSFIQDDNLSKYRMDIATVKTVYGEKTYEKMRSDLKNKKVDNIPISEQLENMLKERYINKPNENIQNNILDQFEKVKQRDIKEILKAANYYKVNGSENIKPTRIIPYQILNKDDIGIWSLKYALSTVLPVAKIYTTLDVKKDITDKIDENKLIILMFSNFKTGHAVLGYKYEYISESSLKVYVHDNNLPLYEDTAENKGINEEIKKSSFMYFEKDSRGIWQWKLNPKIYNVYLYRGKYNSFLPDVTFMISS